MTTHMDNLECECQIMPINNARCQYIDCPDNEYGLTIRATDGTYMHPDCWDEYDRTWKMLHPAANREMQDSSIAAAERKAGA